MGLGQKFLEALERIDGPGHVLPQTISVTDEGLTLEGAVAALDRMSCSFVELKMSLPPERTVKLDQLKKWADALCKRVTYLLEQMGPLEVDAEANEVLVRSTPPHRQPNRIRFYEVLFQAPGTLRMARYETIPGQSGRQRIEMQMTHEVLQKLADDLVQAVETA